MTFVELYGEALSIELGTADTTQLFTTARRKAAISRAEDAFVRMTDCSKRYASLAITTLTQEVSLTAVTDYIRLLGDPSIKIVNDDTTINDIYLQGVDFTRREPEELDRTEPGWRGVDAGTPTSWYLRTDGGILYLGAHPTPEVPDDETWTWRVPYLAAPDPMAADADIPFSIKPSATRLPMLELYKYHQALAHYAAASLEPLRKNYAAYTRQMQLYAGYVAEWLQSKRAGGPEQVRLERNYYKSTVSAISPYSHDWQRWP